MKRRLLSGASLAEVLVAGSIFLLLSGVLYLSLRMALFADKKSESNSDAYRACLLGMTHLQRELRASKVVSVEEDGSVLEFQVMERDDDYNPVVDSTGNPVWSSQVSKVLLDEDGRLTLERGTDRRVLAHLGDGAKLSLTQVSLKVLRIELTAERNQGTDVSKKGRFKAGVDIFVENQPASDDSTLPED